MLEPVDTLEQGIEVGGGERFALGFGRDVDSPIDRRERNRVATRRDGGGGRFVSGGYLHSSGVRWRARVCRGGGRNGDGGGRCSVRLDDEGEDDANCPRADDDGQLPFSRFATLSLCRDFGHAFHHVHLVGGRGREMGRDRLFCREFVDQEFAHAGRGPNLLPEVGEFIGSERVEVSLCQLLDQLLIGGCENGRFTHSWIPPGCWSCLSFDWMHRRSDCLARTISTLTEPRERPILSEMSLIFIPDM